MKKFHLNDRKNKLGHDIFNLTQLGEELVKERQQLIERLQSSNVSYTEAQTLGAIIHKKSKEIKANENDITLKQTEFDSL